MKLRKRIGCTLIIILTFCIFVNLIDTNLDLIENRITIDNSDNSDKSEALPDIDLLKEINLTSCSSLEEKTGFAIVVGISDYPGSSNDLSYCDDDAQDVYSMLINDYNFEPSNIIYLQDSSATTSAMSSAFDTIAAQADSNDVFFFYFSGHGGRDVNTYQYSRVINSPHPYPNYYDNYWSIYSSGGLYMRVHFSRLETEYDYDYVYVGDHDIPYGWYYYEYTGYYPSGFWSGWVPGNEIYIRLISDYSITDYGFRIDYYQVDKYTNTEYLCSYDSIGTPSQSYFDYLLDSKLDAINCNEKFVICDACNSGGLIPEAGASGRYMMTACENDESSLEDPSRQQGCFTYYLLRSLEYASDSNGDGVKSMEECYDYIYPRTVSRSGSLGYTHHPQEYDGISGECVLYPAIGSKSFNVTGNELNYTFEVFGTGAIQNMSLILANVNDTDIIYSIEDVGLMATDVTGFCNYVNSSSLSGETNLDSYGLFVQVQGNKLLTLEHVNSSDYDNDSVYDVQELFYGLDLRSNDTDSDGLDDFIELNGDCDPLNNDTDGDGLLDGLEVYTYFTNPINNDTDTDGLSDGLEILGLNSNATNNDTDGDLMLDGYEYNNDLNLTNNDASGDLDGDMLSNLLEFQLGSSANNTDTDFDTMLDGYEYNCALNLTYDDSGLDYDFDGLTNLVEFGLNTIANDNDTDDDGLLDGEEVYTYFTNPLNNDTDTDGLSDGLEILVLNSNVTNNDTDGDTMLDGYEYNCDLNLTYDDSGLDYDVDGLTNLVEFGLNTIANDSDTDDDGLLDGEEVNVYMTNVLNPDSDGDTLLDGLEILVLNSNATNNDTDGDLMLDGYEYNNDLNLTNNDAGLDHDGDTLSNYLESQLGSRANSTDSDGDLMPDLYEYNNDLNLTLNDANGDLDGDSVFNYIECNLGSQANDIDSDNDYLNDGLEYWTFHTSLIFPDSDFDGLLDGVEVYLYHTYPLSSDTDGDGTPDGLEVALGLNPLNSILSLNTIILNILGIVLFASVGAISFLAVRKKRKGIKATFEIKGTPDTYNGLLVDIKSMYKPKTTKLFPERKNHIETEYRKPVEKSLIRKCQYCGVNTFLPFTCSRCGKSYCANHRLPEFHQCEKLVRACPDCGTRNPSFAFFCTNCGRLLK